MRKAKNAWLVGMIYGLIAFALLVTPMIAYVYSNEDQFFVSGYLGTRELYLTDTEEIQARLIQEYPDAEEGDFVRLIDTDSDWDFIDGTWTDFRFMHAYVSTDDILMSFTVFLVILALVLLKAFKNVTKKIQTPIWMALIGVMLMFLKGVLVYLPNLLFAAAGGLMMFFIFLGFAKRKFDIYKEYSNEKVRIEARTEAQDERI